MPDNKVKSSEQLFAERDAEMAQEQAFLDGLEAENREATEDENATSAERQARIADLNERGHRQADIEARKLSFIDLQKAAEAVPATHKPAAIASVRVSMADDPKRGWERPEHFWAAVVNASMPGARPDRRLTLDPLKPLAAAAGMSQNDGAGGGFAVPPQFSREIWDGMAAMPENLLALTDRYDVTGESLTFPANAETSRATGSRAGGIRGYWIAEADSITTSYPKLRQIKLEPQELAVLVPVTNKLLRNASAMARYVMTKGAEEINFLVNDAIVNGDGHGKPAGIMTAAAKVQVTRGTASTFVQLDASNMWARLHPRSMMRAVWLVNPSVIPQLLNMVLPVTNVAQTENVGGITTNLYSPTGGVGWGTLIGRPIIYSESTKALGTSGDVILWDPASYLTGTQTGGIESASSIHVYFSTGQTAFRFMFAVDGQSALASAITPFDGGNTLSTIIDLS